MATIFKTWGWRYSGTCEGIVFDEWPQSQGMLHVENQCWLLCIVLYNVIDKWVYVATAKIAVALIHHHSQEIYHGPQIHL